MEAVEHLGPGTTSTSTGLTEQEEASASNQIEEDGGTLEDCEEESDKEARQQTNLQPVRQERPRRCACNEHCRAEGRGGIAVRKAAR